jgi:hypothetical protein
LRHTDHFNLFRTEVLKNFETTHLSSDEEDALYRSWLSRTTVEETINYIKVMRKT